MPLFAQPPAAAPDARRPVYRLSLANWTVRRLYHVHGPDGALEMVVERPLLVLREELIIYADEARLAPLLVIKQRAFGVLDRMFDVFSPQSGARLGSIRARGWRSLWRDRWDILDAEGRPAGRMEEEGASWVRRLLPFQQADYRIELGGVPAARIAREGLGVWKQSWTIELLPAPVPLDPRFAVACALLVALVAASRGYR